MDKIIYTAIIGNYDDLKKPSAVTEGWRYICFTDNESLQSDFWEIRHIQKGDKDNKKLAREIKINSTAFLPEHKLSIWIDGSIQINCNLDGFVADFKTDFSIIKHHIRNSILQEAEFCKKNKKDNAEIIDRQIEFYRSDNYEFNNGLVESGLIIRKNTNEVRTFCNFWFEQVEKFSNCDQLSFNYTLYKHPIKIALLDYAVLSREFILYNHLDLAGGKITNPLKVILTGMEHSGTGFLRELIVKNSSLINSGFECGILLSETPKKFNEIEPFYNWLCEDNHEWKLTKEQREYVCDTDLFHEFYSRLHRISPLYKNGEVYLLDETPAYSYCLPDIIKKAPETPILIILRDIEALWHSYKERGFEFEEFIERYLRFKAALFAIVPNKNVKIIQLDDLREFNIKKIEEIFFAIQLELHRTKMISKDKWKSLLEGFNIYFSGNERLGQVDEKQKSILSEIEINSGVDYGKKGAALKNEQDLLLIQTQKYQPIINDIRSKQMRSLKLKNISVSVIIPNYNYGVYLRESLTSVLKSDFPHEKLEIIVVDDNSSDESVKVFEEVVSQTDIQWQLIRNNANVGLAKARNLAIKKANGEFVFILDSDNYITPDCLKKHVNFLIENPGYSACYAPIQRFESNTGKNSTVFSNIPFSYARLIEGNYIDAMSMFRKSDLMEMGLYDEKMPTSGWEDYELWLRLGKANRKVHMIESLPLSFYREHGNSMINKVSSLSYELLITYLKAFYPVNEKRLKSLFCRTDNVNLQISDPLSDVFIQLFYSGNETEFREDSSLSQYITIGKNLVTVSFDLSANKSGLKYIRFNFDHFAGLIVIHSIKIKTTSGNLLKAFDSISIYDIINPTGIESENRNYLSGFINPKFSVAIDDIFSGSSSEDLIIEVLISGVDPAQMDALTKLSAVLFSRYQNQLDSLQKEEKKLNVDFQNIVNELTAEKKNIQTLSVTNSELAQQVKDKEILFVQSEIEKSAAVADKAFLISELTGKNELINQVLAAKTEVEKALLQKNKQIRELEGKLATFEQVISISKTDISYLQDEKLSLSKEIERFKLKIVEGEQLLQRKSEKIYEIEKALINKEFIVSNMENEKQKLQQQLNELTAAVDEKTTRIIELEKKFSSQIEFSQNTWKMKEERHFSELEELKNDLKWYQQAYENKTVYSILKGKLLKFKMRYLNGGSRHNKSIGPDEVDNAAIQHLFDAVYYLEANPDVKKAGVKPLKHYSTTGWREGRNPNTLFDVFHYLETNPDVKNAGVEPFQHYLTFGWKEGRNPSPLFDVKFYLENNPDVKENSIEPLFHYLTHGWREKRNPNPLFDVNFYLESNKDVKTTSIEPLYHYLSHGWREGRNPSKGFDTLSYLSKYPDVEKAGINPLVHYIRTLSQENGHIDLYAPENHIEDLHPHVEVDAKHHEVIEPAIPENTVVLNAIDHSYSKDELTIKNSVWFDATWYATNYKLDHTEDPAKHYTHIGWKLLYNPSDRFSTVQYLLLNKDVEGTGGNPLIHYELFGKNEPNRIYHEPHVIDFDLNNEYKRQQDIFINANYDKSTKKLIVYLVPEIDSISGGIMSICSMARVTKNIEELSDTTIMVATLPSVTTFFQYSKFDAGFNVLRFDQLREYFTDLEEMTIHIPEIYVYYFLLKIKPADADWVRRLKKSQLNILNQNMALMPRLKVVEYLKMFGDSVTITCAHKRYCTKQLRSSYDVPVHFFSTSNLVKYKYKPYADKEDLIVYSPDDNPFKNDILSLLQKAFSNYKFLEIRNMSYEQYLSTITRAKFMITFGEGIDGYFVESIRSGTIPFSVRNYLFFDENFNNYSNIYESYFDMLGKIVTDMKAFENEKKYNSFNSELRALDARVYNDEEYKSNIKDYYLKKYSFPIEEVHKLRKERKKKMPLISITMATYNGAIYLEKQLNSLLSQTYKNVEIIVSDDHSTDSTPEILKHYKEKYGITVVSNKGEKGLNGNFSTAMNLAKGEYISLCDQDDIWEANKLEVLLDRIDDFDIVQGQMVIIDEHDQYHPAQYMHDAYETDKTSLYSIENYVKENPMLGCATLISKRCIEQSLPVPEGFVYHDWWIVLNAILKGKGICNIDIPIIKYRQHSTNTAKSNFWSPSWCQKKYVSDKIITQKMNDYLNPTAKHLLECDMNLMLLYGFARKFAPKLAFEYFDSNSTAFSNRVIEKLLEHINLEKEVDLKYEK